MHQRAALTVTTGTPMRRSSVLQSSLCSLVTLTKRLENLSISVLSSVSVATFRSFSAFARFSFRFANCNIRATERAKYVRANEHALLHIEGFGHVAPSHSKHNLAYLKYCPRLRRRISSPQVSVQCPPSVCGALQTLQRIAIPWSTLLCTCY